MCFMGLPGQLTPDVEYPRLTVRLAWASAPPETVESTITAPLEGELSKLHGIKSLSSVSSEGRSEITIEFHAGINMDMARLEINERLSVLMENLPREVSPPSVSNYIPDEIEKMTGFLTYTLSAPRSPGEVRRYADEYLKLPLRSISGVNDVLISGGNHRHISVELSREQTERLNIHPDEVTNALKDAYLTLSGAQSLRSDLMNTDSLIKRARCTVVQSLRHIEDLQYLPVAFRAAPNNTRQPASTTMTDNNKPEKQENPDNNVTVKLGDISTIRDDFAEPTSFYRLNGKETIILRLQKEPGADIIRTADKVYKTIEALQAALPKDYVLRKESDVSEKMRLELSDLYSTILYALIALGIVILLLFRQNTALRMVAIIITAVVVSMCLASVGFAVFGVGLNIISIAAILLGFGVTVDIVIIMAEFLERENVALRHRHKASTIILRFTVQSRSMAVPLVGSALTTIAVILPLMALNTELQQYLWDFTITSVIIVCTSVMVSLSFVPLLCYYWLPRNIIPVSEEIPNHDIHSPSFSTPTLQEPQDTAQRFGYLSTHFGLNVEPERFNTIFYRVYAALIQRITRWKKTALFALMIVGGLPLWLLPGRIETPYLAPVYNEVFDSPLYGYLKPYLYTYLGGAWNLFSNRLPRGDMWQIGNEQYLMVYLKLPNGNRIERINTLAKAIEAEILRYGSAVALLTTSVSNDERAWIKVEFPRHQADPTFPYKLKNYLVAYATRLGGLEVSVLGFGDSFSTGLGGSPVSFMVKARGYNYEDVKSLAQEFRRVLERHPRVSQVDIDRSVYWGEPEVFEQIIRLDRELLLRSSATIEQLLPFIRLNAIGTIGGSSFKLGAEEISYDVKFAGYKDTQASELMERILYDSRGTQLKLGSIARLEQQKTLSRIIRENRQYLRTITFEFLGPYRYGEEYLKQALASIPLRAGYSLEYERGGFMFGDENTLSILNSLALSVLLIFMVGAAMFESLRAPLIIVSTIPIALMGAVYSLHWFDLGLDRGAFAGMLLLIALAVNNAIIMVYQVLFHKSRFNDGITVENLIWVCFRRLRPVALTTSITALMMAPLVLQDNHGFWQTLGATVIGGVIWSGFFLIVAIPVFVSSLYRFDAHISNSA